MKVLAATDSIFCRVAFENNRTCNYYVNCTNPAAAEYDHPQLGRIPMCNEHGAKKGVKDTERWHPYPEDD